MSILTPPARETARGLAADLADSERWYAVHTLPFAEARAEVSSIANASGPFSRNGIRPFDTLAD